MSRFLSSLLVIGLLATAAPATVVFSWVATTEPGIIGGGYAPSGYTSWSLFMTVDNNVAQVQMYASLSGPSTTGTFYHELNYGGDWTPRTNWIINLEPLLEFDTYLTMPVSGALQGAAINVVNDPSIRSASFTDTLIDQTWAVASGANSGPGTFMVARVTVRDNTTGSWAVWGQETAPIPIPEYTASGVGPLFVPEPATVLVLLGGALLAVIRRR